MSKDDFKNMDNIEKVEFINDNLRQGMSFNDIYNATLNNHELLRSREALLNQFRKAGYRINEKPRKNHIPDDSPPLPAPSSGEKLAADYINSERLLILAEQSQNILEMLEWWKSNFYPAQDTPGTRLNLPLPDGDEVRKTIRISSQVWEKWKAFCGQNPGYNEKDLMARALLFFIEER
jgi:hypothetical protein